MASDLDRAYVINGDDLRIALGSRFWSFEPQADSTVGHLRSPEEVTRIILGEMAKPLETRAAPASVSTVETHCHHTPCTCPWPPGSSTPPCLPDCPLQDEELLAMQQLLDALAPLNGFTVARVLKWARARYGL